MRRYVWLLLLAVPVLFVMGCGGDGHDRINISRSGTLTTNDILLADNSRADLVRVRATRDGFIHVTMTGSNVDPYVQVFEGAAYNFEDLQDLFDAGKLIDSDDDGGLGDSAELVFRAEDNQVYTIVLTTSEGNDLGSYRYTIREVDDDDVVVASAEAGDKNTPAEVKFKK
ncbi:MAG: hypothetical protein ABFE08_21290 [Armatimonadia bacterium]